MPRPCLPATYTSHHDSAHVPDSANFGYHAHPPAGSIDGFPHAPVQGLGHLLQLAARQHRLYLLALLGLERQPDGHLLNACELDLRAQGQAVRAMQVDSNER